MAESLVHGTYRNANGIQESTSPHDSNHRYYHVCSNGGDNDLDDVIFWGIRSSYLFHVIRFGNGRSRDNASSDDADLDRC